MRPFRFCPADSSPLEVPDGEGGRRCPKCGRSWYRNASPTVGAAIVRDGKALVTVRGREPKKGRLDVPGGFLGPMELPVDGLVREVKEELGVAVEVASEDCISMAVHTYGDEDEPVLALGFLTTYVAGEYSPDDDVADLRWVEASELDDLDFAWPHDRELVRKALEHG